MNLGIARPFGIRLARLGLARVVIVAAIAAMQIATMSRISTASGAENIVVGSDVVDGWNSIHHATRAFLGADSSGTPLIDVCATLAQALKGIGNGCPLKPGGTVVTILKTGPPYNASNPDRLPVLVQSQNAKWMGWVDEWALSPIIPKNIVVRLSRANLNPPEAAVAWRSADGSAKNIFYLPNNTSVRFLGPQNSTVAQVVILDGQHAGERAWVLPVEVVSPGDSGFLTWLR